MAGFCKLSIIYLAAAFWLSFMLHGGDHFAFLQLFLNTRLIGSVAGSEVALVVLGLAFAFGLVDARRDIVSRIGYALAAFLAGVCFFSAFTIIKSSLTMIMPFWADPALARIDAWLHGGTVPWQAAQDLAGHLGGASTWQFVYISLWGPIAIFYPVILALVDGDRARVARHLRLYALAWIVLGNGLALAFMSGGPVYFDRIEGGDAFAGLRADLAATGIADSAIGHIQEALWNAYATGQQGLGSGISAFPSMHVAVAVLPVFYLLDRSPRAAIPAAAFPLTILTLSVATGYHYAIDGYASIAGVALLWWVFCRQALGAGSAEVTPRPVAAAAGRSA